MLASLSILGVIARMAMTFAENMQMLARSREEAHTDVLTGLGNRRRLLADLEQRLAPGAPRITLALFDLNGFKQYNDAFGHPAGDALLGRLGHNLARFITRRGEAYRMGGDEFCIVFESGDDPPDFVIAGAERALREHGEGFDITRVVRRRHAARRRDRRLGGARPRRPAHVRAEEGRPPDRRGALDERPAHGDLRARPRSRTSNSRASSRSPRRSR